MSYTEHRENGVTVEYSYKRRCEHCGHVHGTNHSPRDGVQKKCPKCRKTPPGTSSPLQFLGWEEKTDA